jgi:hypothetical protein
MIRSAPPLSEDLRDFPPLPAPLRRGRELTSLPAKKKPGCGYSFGEPAECLPASFQSVVDRPVLFA